MNKFKVKIQLLIKIERKGKSYQFRNVLIMLLLATKITSGTYLAEEYYYKEQKKTMVNAHSVSLANKLV